jgi:ribonucleases P/MRP protein subunit RPP40
VIFRREKNELAILLDLSKAFDNVDHSILIAKLKRYSFSTNSLALIKNYLSNRYTISKLKDCFSDKRLNEEGIPQGSILDPLFFIIFFQ